MELEQPSLFTAVTKTELFPCPQGLVKRYTVLLEVAEKDQQRTSHSVFRSESLETEPTQLPQQGIGEERLRQEHSWEITAGSLTR